MKHRSLFSFLILFLPFTLLHAGPKRFFSGDPSSDVDRRVTEEEQWRGEDQLNDFDQSRFQERIDQCLVFEKENAPEEVTDEADQKDNRRREDLVRLAAKKYQSEAALLYAGLALKALNSATDFRALTLENLPNQKIQAMSQKEERLALLKQKEAVLESIACDYMDAAEAIHFREKGPKPYLEAASAQNRILDFLNEICELADQERLTSEKREQLLGAIKQAKEVAANLRGNPNHPFPLIDSRYSGPRFFPDMPH